MFENITLGFCKWDIPALIVLIAVVAVFLVHQARHKQRKKEYQTQLKELADTAAAGMDIKQTAD